MALLNIYGESILDEVVITKFSALSKLLKIINSNPQISQNRLKKESGYSGGKIHHSVKALEIMRLVNKEENGLTLTEFGKKTLEEFNSNKQITPENLRRGCEYVRLFANMYNKNPTITSPTELFKIFNNELMLKYPKTNSKLIGSAVRRYLEGMHNIKLRAGARMNFNGSMESNGITLTKSRVRQYKFPNNPNSETEDILISHIKLIKDIRELSLDESVNKYGKEVVEKVLKHLWS